MSVLNHNNISQYLKNYLVNLPKKGRGEVSRIAHYLGVSTTLVSQFLAGSKSLTLEQSQKLISYLGMTGIEADYFMNLILLERSGTSDLKKFWQIKLSEIKEKSKSINERIQIDRALTETEKAKFYSSPLYPAIQLYTSTGVDGKSMEEVTQRFNLSRLEASEILQFLVASGFCIEKNSRYYLGLQKTHLAADSPYLPKHHTNWRIRAIVRSDNLQNDELMYTAPVSLSKKDFHKLREEMVVFIKHFLDSVHASDAEEIACFNLDFFWIQK